MYTESVKIYILIDPRDNEIRYVGKTKAHLSKRRGQHLNDVRKGERSWRANWIRNLLRCGYKPRIELVQEVPADQWAAAESYWIGFYRGLGCRLTNGTIGGDGGYSPTQDVRFRYGVANIGNTYRLGKPHSDETKALLRIAGLRPENVARLKTVRLGTTDSDETKRRKSEAQTRRNQDPTQRQSRSIALKGRPKSPETIANMRAAQQKRRAQERSITTD